MSLNNDDENYEKIQRYVRAELLAMRFNEFSRHRPNCANRTELHTLGFWKINVSKSFVPTDVDSGSRRSMRNRDRANTYYQRFASGDQGCDDSKSNLALSGDILKSPNINLIDNRSISSSHLMPAFAKRHFVVASTTRCSNIETIEKSDDEILLNTNEDANTSKPANYLSEWEPDKRFCSQQKALQEGENLMGLSPTTSMLSSNRHGNLNIHSSTSERRIGSGRLVPRDDNWEFKNQDGAVLPLDNKEKESCQQQRQRTFSGRQLERSTEKLVDRRSHPHSHQDRKAIDMREVYDNKKTVSTQGSRGRSINKDKFNYGDSNNYGSGRGKRTNFYQKNDKNEEPEWFSAGPTSQLETIDLHGFDGLEKNEDTTFEAAKSNPKASTENENPAKSISSPASTVLCDESNHGSIDNIKEDNDENRPPHNPPDSLISGTTDDVEFNFDAFLNIDLMDNTLMGNECEIRGELAGTSRFSRWFGGPKISVKTHDCITSYADSKIPDTHNIPSVNDLEAQMKKVDLRRENLVESITEYTQQQQALKNRDEKTCSGDTEAFQKLLQQLGSSQNKLQNIYQQLPSNVVSVHKPPGRSFSLDPRLTNVMNNSSMENNNLQRESLSFSKQMDPMQYRNIEGHPHGSPSVHSLAQLPSFPQCDSNTFQHEKPIRLEVQHLVQTLIHGEITADFLKQELGNPNGSPHSKDVISNALREYFNYCETDGRNFDQSKQPYQKLQNDEVMFQQNRCNNISEDVPPQNIQGQIVNQHMRHTNSPTPLAFTPTSVLRKMTADKDASLHGAASITCSNNTKQLYQYQFPTNQNKLVPQNVTNALQQINSSGHQPRMILGGNYSVQHQLNSISPQLSPKGISQVQQPRSQQIKWPNNFNQQGTKSMGRPILKGSLNSASPQQAPQGPGPGQGPFAHKIELQQMLLQRLNTSHTPELTIVNNEQLQSYPLSDGNSSTQQQQHFFHQQRQLPKHRMVQNNIADQAQSHLNQLQIPISHITPGGLSDQSGCTGTLPTNYNKGSNYFHHRDDRLSPATNQLAQWFSPELLARASAGKLPHLKINQTLSLEEFERSIQHSSTAVHN